MTIPFTPPLHDTNGSGTPALSVLLRRLDDLDATVQTLTERVTELEVADRPAPPRDELNEKLLDFLRVHRGLKFTGQLVAENLGESPSSVYSRLRTLANNGHLTYDKPDGRIGLFWMPTEVPASESD